MTQLSDADRTRIAQLVRDTARAEILPRFQNLSEAEIDQKTGPQDLVTAADLAAEQALTEGLRRLFPSALVVGEEAISATPSLRDDLDRAELCFIIDPVDGTWNFAHGMPLFGVILAATRRGQPVYGMLHDPVCDSWMTAHEDGPALHVHGDGRQHRLATAPAPSLAKSNGYMHFYLMSQPQKDAVAPHLAAFGKVSTIRCSCHEYRMLAKGSVDFCLSTILNPWDHAAGALICRQAGGHVAMLDGSPYATQPRRGALLAAGDESTWHRVADLLRAPLEAA